MAKDPIDVDRGLAHVRGAEWIEEQKRLSRSPRERHAEGEARRHGPGSGAVGAFPVPQDDDIKPRSDEKREGFEANQAKRVKGGPVRGDEPLSPYAGADESGAYRRADGSRGEKGA